MPLRKIQKETEDFSANRYKKHEWTYIFLLILFGLLYGIKDNIHIAEMGRWKGTDYQEGIKD